jgi:hypothetical protein
MYTDDHFQEISVKGKHGNGISIDEHTASVYNYPTFNTAAANGGWSHWNRSGGIGSYGQNTDPIYIFGNQPYSHWWANDPTATAEYLLYQSPAFDGGYRSVQAIICMEDLSPVDESKIFPAWNASNGGATNYQWTSISRIENTHFYLCKVEGISQDGTNDLVGFYISPGCKAYVSFVLMENKPYCTRIPLSEERNPSYLYYNIDVTPKTISFWMKSNSNKIPTMSSDRPLLLLGGELGNQTGTYLECMITRNDDARFINPGKIGLVAYISNSSYYCHIEGIDPLDGEWHMVTIELNKEGKARLWVDDEYADTNSYGTDVNFGNILRVGHNYIPSSQSQVYTGLANCKFDDICIRTEHYSTSEILSWYFSDREFYNPYDYSFSV